MVAQDFKSDLPRANLQNETQWGLNPQPKSNYAITISNSHINIKHQQMTLCWSHGGVHDDFVNQTIFVPGSNIKRQHMNTNFWWANLASVMTGGGKDRSETKDGI